MNARASLERRKDHNSIVLMDRESFIIRFVPPMIRPTRVRYQCRLMLILYETTLGLDYVYPFPV